jgi:hypothetical protein
VSELEKKRDSAVDAQREKQQREAGEDTKQKGDDKDVDATASLMPWDADVEHIMERMSLFVRDLRMSMSHTEFRSLLTSYRELSPMGRRAVANRMQRNHLDHLLRALHTGDYQLYQATWKSDAEALEASEVRVATDDNPGSDRIDNGG